MSAIDDSTRRYEAWLRQQLGAELVAADLDRKHKRMRAGPFPFLRATYWRWAETILDIAPQLRTAPVVLAIGDTHLENFGTWRDAEGRLVWGLNDFDEAAEMPALLDLVRLATSALLVRGRADPDADAIATAILTGYRRGLERPVPFILERDNKWLRKLVLLPESQRTAFWQAMDGLPAATPPARFQSALRRELPQVCDVVEFTRRTAGTGSLGRPRFVARARWRGGPLLREAKALVPSAWSLAHAPHDTAIRSAEIALTPLRAPDPHYQVDAGVVTRTLAPNSRKIEVDDDAGDLLSTDMLTAMGQEVACCHVGVSACGPALLADLRQRPANWLKASAKAAALQVVTEQKQFR